MGKGLEESDYIVSPARCCQYPVLLSAAPLNPYHRQSPTSARSLCSSLKVLEAIARNDPPVQTGPVNMGLDLPVYLPLHNRSGLICRIEKGGIVCRAIRVQFC
jgi:hypothetical protein